MHNITAIHVPVEGERTIITVDRDDWHALARVIGAESIERVRVGSTTALVVDETGRLSGKPMNRVASLLYGYGVRHSEPICGDVLVVTEGFTPEGPDFIDMPDPAERMAWLDGVAS